MGTLLGDSVDITTRAPLKTRRVDDASIVMPIAGETVTFEYDNSGALASATGQAAGIMIYAKLDFDGILNSFKDKGGDMYDSSFEFVTGTVLTTALVLDIEREVDNWRRFTVTEKFAAMAQLMKTNGQYWIDHADGAVWGLAAATVADDTANYSYKAPVQATGPSVATSVKITDGTDTAAVLGRTTGTEQPADSDNALVVYDVGGGAATASAEYQATTNGRDGTVVFTSTSTLTLSSTPITVNSEDLVYIREVDATGNTAALFVNGAGGVHLEIASGVITKSGGADFSSDGVYELGYNGQKKAYVAVQSADQVVPLVLDSLRYTTPEHIIDVTNVAAATYRVMFSMKDFSNNSIQWALVGGASIKLYTTNDGNDDTTAIGNWQQDVSGDAPSGTDTSGHYFMDTKLKCLNMMIEYITTDATNAIDVWVMKGN